MYEYAYFYLKPYLHNKFLLDSTKVRQVDRIKYLCKLIYKTYVIIIIIRGWKYENIDPN